MTTISDNNKKIVIRLYEQGLNAGNLDVVNELVSEDVVTHTHSSLTHRRAPIQ